MLATGCSDEYVHDRHDDSSWVSGDFCYEVIFVMQL